MLGWSLVLAVSIANLTPGTPVRRVISGAQVDTFNLSLLSHQALDGIVDQGETDLTVTIVAPDGRRLATFDGRDHGAERVSLITSEGGTYRLEVRTVVSTARQASYRVAFEPPRAPTPQDESRIEAERLASAAKQLFGKGDAAALRQSLPMLVEARSIWQAVGERSAELWTLASSADTHYSLAEYSDADLEYREARALARDLEDLRTEAEVVNNLGMVAWSLGHIPEALGFLEEALGYWRSLKLTYGEAVGLSNRGILLWETGDYDDARRHDLRALSLFRGLNDRRGQAYALNNIGVVLEALGDQQTALDYLGRAILLFRATSDWLAEGRAMVRQSRIQLALGAKRSALVNAERGLTVIRRSGDRLAEADALNQLARSFEATGETARARANYDAALELSRLVGSRRAESDALHAIGMAAHAAGDWDAAADWFHQALEARRAVGLRGPQAETLFRLARTERARGDLASARLALESAIDLVEQLREGIFEPEPRASYSSSRRGYYSAYLDLLIQYHHQQPSAGFDRLAFDASERSRARGLTELLRESRNSARASRDSVLVERERQLRKELNYWSWLAWQQADRVDAARRTVAATQIERLENERRVVEGDLRRTDPWSAALLRPDPIPLAAVQRDVLDKDTVLLEYWLGEEQSHLWAVTSDGVRVVDLPSQAIVERRARHFYDLVSRGPVEEPADESTGAQSGEAAALSRLLLSPVADVLNRRRVLIVADGALHYIPFAALPDPHGAGPLAARHEIVSVPSATTLALLRRDDDQRPPATKTLAMFADPVFDRADPRVKPADPAAQRPATEPRPRRFSRLPFSRDEAEQIMSLVPADQRLTALDFDASRSVATSAGISQYQLVHFATHAVQNDRHPELSGIVLSLVTAAGRDQDGFLRLHDLYDLRLRASLVVLSACETGLGKQVSGEGIIGFAQALFSAGAARVISTLWKVDDEATATLMQLFYKNLLGSQAAPAEALRAAQNTMMAQRRWQEPYYWSGFVLQGSW